MNFALSTDATARPALLGKTARSLGHGARHLGRGVGACGDAAGFSVDCVKWVAANEAGYMSAGDVEIHWKAVVGTRHCGEGAFSRLALETSLPKALNQAVSGREH